MTLIALGYDTEVCQVGTSVSEKHCQPEDESCMSIQNLDSHLPG
jgi:hypothetical protein